jgi:hypothetical protein
MPQVNGLHDGFGLQPDRIQRVSKPSTAHTYAPSFGQNYQFNYGPAAVVTLSEAAQRWLRWLKSSG